VGGSGVKKRRGEEIEEELGSSSRSAVGMCERKGNIGWRVVTRDQVARILSSAARVRLPRLINLRGTR
jgi:hypothetical protein